MRYDWLVDLFLCLHFAYLAFVVFGGFLAWRWPRAWFAHLAAAVWAVLIVLEWVDCPLTWAENWARRGAGMAQVPGFISHYVTGVIYPPEYLQQARLAVAAAVLISWLGALVAWRRRRAKVRASSCLPGQFGDTTGAERLGDT